MTYQVRFTPLAEAFAKANSSLAAVEEKVRGELAEDIHGKFGGKRDINKLIFHAFEVAGVDYVCYPKDGVLEIDTRSDEELDEPLSGGPFKGYRVIMPRGDSE